MNIKNLELLATYLEALPVNYIHFDMDTFLDGVRDSGARTWEPECGTVACALGHAPNVPGIPKPLVEGENWYAYSDRVLGLGDKDWEWCFSSDWAEVDNTPQGAATRIRYLLKHPDLEGWDYYGVGSMEEALSSRGLT